VSRWRLEERWLRLAAGAAPEPRWQSALTQFDAWLDRSPPHVRLSVLIPSEFARYLVIPWQPRLQGADDHAAYVRYCFEQIHGAGAAGWTCRAAESRYGEPALACALDSRLLAGLTEAAVARGRRIVHVQPALVHAWNVSRAALPAGRLWLALVEEGWATLLLAEDGSPRHLRSQRVASSALSPWLERETRALGLDGPEAPLFVVGTPAGATLLGTTPLPYDVPEAALAKPLQPA